MELKHKTKPSSIEYKVSKETEKKFTPKDPSLLRELREKSCPIEQVYLSHPSEPWSLRLRETTTADGQEYSAALKSRSESQNILVRDEIETPISETAYHFYAGNPRFPRLHKLRAEAYPGVTIDWVEGYDLPVIEAEGEESIAALEGYESGLENVSSEPSFQSEIMAHLLFQVEHGEDALAPQDNLDSQVVLREVMGRLGEMPVIVGLSGRSGSGKSTLAVEMAQLLGNKDISSVILSTDDYNRGESWLCQRFGVEVWQNWDDPCGL